MRSTNIQQFLVGVLHAGGDTASCSVGIRGRESLCHTSLTTTQHDSASLSKTVNSYLIRACCFLADAVLLPFGSVHFFIFFMFICEVTASWYLIMAVLTLLSVSWDLGILFSIVSAVCFDVQIVVVFIFFFVFCDIKSDILVSQDVCQLLMLHRVFTRKAADYQSFSVSFIEMWL